MKTGQKESRGSFPCVVLSLEKCFSASQRIIHARPTHKQSPCQSVSQSVSEPVGQSTIQPRPPANQWLIILYSSHPLTLYPPNTPTPSPPLTNAWEIYRPGPLLLPLHIQTCCSALLGQNYLRYVIFLSYPHFISVYLTSQKRCPLGTIFNPRHIDIMTRVNV